MMDQTPLLWALGGLFGALSGMAGYCIKLRADLNAHRVLTAEKYATVAHVVAIENKLSESIDGLRREIGGMTAAIHEMIGFHKAEKKRD